MRLLLLLLLLTACQTVQEPALPQGKTVQLWATEYYVHEATSVASGYPLLDSDGKKLSLPISQRDYCACGIEGTCRVDGEMYDWIGSKATNLPFTCKWNAHNARWRRAKFEFGKGNKSNPLEPYVSIAADQSIYPFGTRIFIPEAKGVKLPNGKVHDGWFRVDDVGGAIKGNHIDVFTLKKGSNPFSFIRSSASQTFLAIVP